MRSGMARANEGSHSFTCHSTRLYTHMAPPERGRTRPVTLQLTNLSTLKG